MTNYDIVFQRLLDEGYEFKFNQYLKDGYELFKKHIGGFAAFFAIIMPIYFAAGYFLGDYGSAITNVLQPSITAGALLVANEVFRGNKPNFGKFFEGFRFFMVLLLLSIASGLLIFIGLIFLIIPGIYLAVAYSFANLFVLFLGYDFWPAMELSRKIISQKWWQFFGFFMLMGLINIGGLLAFGVGVIFTAPATLCMTYVAFEDIIGGAIRKYGTPASDSQNEFSTENNEEIKSNE
jgi:hypothetical protein